MGLFYLYDDSNIIHGEGSCPDGDEHLQARDGVMVGIGEIPNNMTYPTEPSKPFDYYRKSAYPPIGDQLDMLWHGMDDGTLPKVNGFYNSIKAVKDNIPKE